MLKRVCDISSNEYFIHIDQIYNNNYLYKKQNIIKSISKAVKYVKTIRGRCDHLFESNYKLPSEDQKLFIEHTMEN